MLKKTVCFFISVILIVSMCSCHDEDTSNLIYKTTSEDYGDTGGITLPIDVNNTAVSIMLTSEVSELSDKIVIKELAKRTGLNINIIRVPKSEMAQETKVLLSTNELPDILCDSMELDEINSLGVKGIFVPINKYLNELPNFNRVFVENEEYSNIFDIYTASDDNLYVFPGYENKKRVENVMLYRKDIFEKNNIRMWENSFEFYKALKKLKEIYPDSIPYTTRRKNLLFDDWSLSFGIDFPGLCYDYDKKEWIYSCVDERCKEMLDYIRKLYYEGLIDEDFLTSSEVSWEAEMTADKKGFVTFDSIEYMNIFYDKVKEKNPEYELSYANPIGSDAKIKGVKTITEGPCVANNQNKLISLKLLDYLLSPSGIELMTLGIRNKTYIFDSDDKVNYLGFSADKNVSIKDLEEKYGLFISGLYRSADKRSAYYLYSENQQKAIDTMIIENRLKEEYPYVKLTKEERALVNELENNILNRAYAFASDYVLSSDTDEAAFEKWVNDANALGVETILNIYNSNH